MAWREISADGETWKVDALFERNQGGSDSWQLVLSFRQAESRPSARPVWALCPSVQGPRATVYLEADLLPDDTLRELLSLHLNVV